MPEDRIFCGTGRVKEAKYGKQLVLSFSEADLQKLGDNLNGKGWVTAYVCKRKTAKNDVTHYLQIAVPKDRREHAPDEPPSTMKEPDEVPADDVNDMPF